MATAGFDMRPYFSTEMHDLRGAIEMQAFHISAARKAGRNFAVSLEALCELSDRYQEAVAKWDGSPEQETGYRAMIAQMNLQKET